MCIVFIKRQNTRYTPYSLNMHTSHFLYNTRAIAHARSRTARLGGAAAPIDCWASVPHALYPTFTPCTPRVSFLSVIETRLAPKRSSLLMPWR